MHALGMPLPSCRATLSAAVLLAIMNGMRAGYVHANDDLVDGVGSIHRFIVPSGAARRRITHLRLDQLPDGGIARLRAWGVVFRDFERELAHEAVGRINLLSEEMGGRAVGATDSHYGQSLHGMAQTQMFCL